MTPWTLAYLIIGAAFTLVECSAAIWGQKGSTLSEHIWYRWLPSKWQRAAMIGFGMTLCTFHLAFHWTVLWFAPFAAWLVATVVWKEWKLLQLRTEQAYFNALFGATSMYAPDPAWKTLWRFK